MQLISRKMGIRSAKRDELWIILDEMQNDKLTKKVLILTVSGALKLG